MKEHMQMGEGGEGCLHGILPRDARYCWLSCGTCKISLPSVTHLILQLLTDSACLLCSLRLGILT